MYNNADIFTSDKKRELIHMAQTHRPHLIAICEVKPKKGALRELHEFEFEDYKLVNQTNVDNKTIGRGIILLAHSSIQHLIVDVSCSINQVEFIEACVVEVRLSGSDMLLFACIYRSPTKTAHSDDNNNKLNSLIKEIASSKNHSHKCIVGDFNFPTINWNNWTTPHMEESKEEKFLDALRDSFLHQHVDEPTRCRGTDDPSIVDLILTSEANQLNNLDYLSPLGKSDHCVLTFSVDCHTEGKPKSTRYKYDSADFEEMRKDLDSSNWQQEFIRTVDQKSVEDLWKIFKDKFLNLRNSFVPLKEVGGQDWRKKGKVPIGRELRNEVAAKKRLHRKWRRSQPNDKDRNRANYIVARNRVNRMMTQAHRQYEQRICENSKNKPKIFWSHVRSKMKSSSTVSSLLNEPTDKKSLKHEDNEKADILQRQFCSVFTKEPEGDLPDFPKRTDTSISDIIITKEMVAKEIKRLDPNKSFGPDEVHPKMLIELSDHISEPLALIMNKTLTEGTLPKEWKMAHVTPIYKNKGAKNLAINYRPVSLTSVVCKLMERILRSHIMKHLVDLNLLSTKQYGFIGKRSTVTQLLYYLDKCCESISEGKVVDSIYFDFAKAFDTVPHRRLCKKLKAYGIDGSIADWITSFLTERKQLVKVNQSHSSIDDVISGIPQGSVLGPLLFVLYINDLPESVISSILLFADDTKLFKEVNSIADSLSIQRDIDELVRWSKDWLLQFHPDKCHVLTLGKFANIKHAHPYTLDGNQLEHVFMEKDLGILVDSELTFEDHISKQVNKANSILGTIKRGFAKLSPTALKTLYSTFVRPHLEHSQSVWSPKLRKHCNLIEGVQRRATRLVERYHNLSYEERLRRLDLPTLEFRRNFCDMVQVYKHIHIYDKDTIPNKFKTRSRPQRRHKFELLPNFGNDGFRGAQTKFFYYRTIPRWNALPKDVVEAKTIKCFKEKLNKAWHNHPKRFDTRNL